MLGLVQLHQYYRQHQSDKGLFYFTMDKHMIQVIRTMLLMIVLMAVAASCLPARHRRSGRMIDTCDMKEKENLCYQCGLLIKDTHGLEIYSSCCNEGDDGETVQFCRVLVISTLTNGKK